MSNLPARRGGNNDGTLVIEDAQVLFRNFAGKEGMYNAEGDRNFCVLLDEDTAAAMIEDGWNIKRLKPRGEDQEVGDPYIQVSVGFKARPPRMVLITSKGRTDIGQHECALFDWVDIKTVDLIIRPYNWNVNGRSGIKAYLKSFFLTIEEDVLDQKYSEVPEIGAGESGEQFKELESSKDAGQDPNEDIVDAEIVEDE